MVLSKLLSNTPCRVCLSELQAVVVGVGLRKWACSGHHELADLPPLNSSIFRAIHFDDVRDGVLSSAPAAVGRYLFCWRLDYAAWIIFRVLLVSPFVPGVVLGSGMTSSVVPLAKPSCAFLAFFGWRLSSQDISITEVANACRWLIECESAMWKATDLKGILVCSMMHEICKCGETPGQVAERIRSNSANSKAIEGIRALLNKPVLSLNTFEPMCHENYTQLNLVATLQ
eukprot:s1776_g5.t1